MFEQGSLISIGKSFIFKGLNLLRTDKTIIEEEAEGGEKTLEDVEDKVEKDIIRQYLKPSTTGIFFKDKICKYF